MTSKGGYTVTMPATPGAVPTTIEAGLSLRDARRVALRASKGRRDLCGQDVRIEDASGKLREYAGPAR